MQIIEFDQSLLALHNETIRKFLAQQATSSDGMRFDYQQQQQQSHQQSQTHPVVLASQGEVNFEDKYIPVDENFNGIKKSAVLRFEPDVEPERFYTMLETLVFLVPDQDPLIHWIGEKALLELAKNTKFFSGGVELRHLPPGFYWDFDRQALGYESLSLEKVNLLKTQKPFNLIHDEDEKVQTMGSVKQQQWFDVLSQVHRETIGPLNTLLLKRDLECFLGACKKKGIDFESLPALTEEFRGNSAPLMLGMMTTIVELEKVLGDAVFVLSKLAKGKIDFTKNEARRLLFHHQSVLPCDDHHEMALAKAILSANIRYRSFPFLYEIFEIINDKKRHIQDDTLKDGKSIFQEVKKLILSIFISQSFVEKTSDSDEALKQSAIKIIDSFVLLFGPWSVAGQDPQTPSPPELIKETIGFIVQDYMKMMDSSRCNNVLGQSYYFENIDFYDRVLDSIKDFLPNFSLIDGGLKFLSNPMQIYNKRKLLFEYHEFFQLALYKKIPIAEIYSAIETMDKKTELRGLLPRLSPLVLVFKGFLENVNILIQFLEKKTEFQSFLKKIIFSVSYSLNLKNADFNQRFFLENLFLRWAYAVDPMSFDIEVFLSWFMGFSNFFHPINSDCYVFFHYALFAVLKKQQFVQEDFSGSVQLDGAVLVDGAMIADDDLALMKPRDLSQSRMLAKDFVAAYFSLVEIHRQNKSTQEVYQKARDQIFEQYLGPISCVQELPANLVDQINSALPATLVTRAKIMLKKVILGCDEKEVPAFLNVFLDFYEHLKNKKESGEMPLSLTWCFGMLSRIPWGLMSFDLRSFKLFLEGLLNRSVEFGFSALPAFLEAFPAYAFSVDLFERYSSMLQKISQKRGLLLLGQCYPVLSRLLELEKHHPAQHSESAEEKKSEAPLDPIENIFYALTSLSQKYPIFSEDFCVLLCHLKDSRLVDIDQLLGFLYQHLEQEVLEELLFSYKDSPDDLVEIFGFIQQKTKDDDVKKQFFDFLSRIVLGEDKKRVFISDVEENWSRIEARLPLFSGDPPYPTLESLRFEQSPVVKKDLASLVGDTFNKRSAEEKVKAITDAMEYCLGTMGAFHPEQRDTLLLALSNKNHCNFRVQTGEGKTRIIAALLSILWLESGVAIDYVTDNQALSEELHHGYRAFFKLIHCPVAILKQGDPPASYHRSGINLFIGNRDLSNFKSSALLERNFEVWSEPEKRVLVVDESHRVLSGPIVQQHSFGITASCEDGLEQALSDVDNWFHYCLKEGKNRTLQLLKKELKLNVKEEILGDMLLACQRARTLRKDIDYCILPESMIFHDGRWIFASAVVPIDQTNHRIPAKRSEFYRDCSVQFQQPFLMRALCLFLKKHECLNVIVPTATRTLALGSTDQLMKAYRQGQMFFFSGTPAQPPGLSFEFHDIPRHRANARVDRGIQWVKDEKRKTVAIRQHILEASKSHRPVIIFCKDGSQVMYLKDALSHFTHCDFYVSKADTKSSEERALLRAATKTEKTVVIITSTQGLGADFQVNDRIEALGGYLGLMTYLSEDPQTHQTLARVGRQGMRGETVIVVSQAEYAAYTGSRNFLYPEQELAKYHQQQAIREREHSRWLARLRWVYDSYQEEYLKQPREEKEQKFIPAAQREMEIYAKKAPAEPVFAQYENNIWELWNKYISHEEVKVAEPQPMKLSSPRLYSYQPIERFARAWDPVHFGQPKVYTSFFAKTRAGIFPGVNAGVEMQALWLCIRTRTREGRGLFANTRASLRALGIPPSHGLLSMFLLMGSAYLATEVCCFYAGFSSSLNLLLRFPSVPWQVHALMGGLVLGALLLFALTYYCLKSQERVLKEIAPYMNPRIGMITD